MKNDASAFLHMRIAPFEIEELDQLRKQETDLPTRSEMMRRLIARASGRGERERSDKRAAPR